LRLRSTIIAMPSIPSELITDVERIASCRRLLLLQQPDVINEPQWSNQCKDGEAYARENHETLCGDTVSAASAATFPLQRETSVPCSKSYSDYRASSRPRSLISIININVTWKILHLKAVKISRRVRISLWKRIGRLRLKWTAFIRRGTRYIYINTKKWIFSIPSRMNSTLRYQNNP